MRYALSLSVLIALTGCQPEPVLHDWDDDRAALVAACDAPAGPTDFDSFDQGLTVPTASTYAYIGDTPVIDGETIVLGGLYDVQFFDLDDSGTYQRTTFLEGPTGYAFGRELTLSQGRAFIGETNYQEPGQSALTGRVRAYMRDDLGQWSLDPHTPYITAADLGMTSGTEHIGVGYNMQMQGTTAVVGVQRADHNGVSAKAVFTYSDDNGWQRDRLWTGTDAGAIALADDYIAIYKRTSYAIDIYKRTGGVWSASPVATIPRPAGGSTQYGRCANCLKFDGDRLIIGDLYVNGQTGGAYVFERQPGSESFALAQTLLPPSHGSQYGDLWGFTLATAPDRLYLGTANANSVRIHTWDEATGQYVFETSLDDGTDSGLGRGISVHDGRLLVGRYKAARTEGAGADRARLYVGDEGVFAYCDPIPEGETACIVGTPTDWDADGVDDGCRGVGGFIDPSVTIPPGTQMGDDVQVLAQAALGSGNILHDGVTIGVRASVGNNNVLSAGTILGRRVELGSRNTLLAGTVTSRSVRIGDDNHIGGQLGYAAEVGDHVDLPDVTLGSLVIVGDPDAGAGQVSCPGPLVIARSSVVADSPTGTLTCAGSAIIGPDSVVESAVLGDNVRLRKQVFLGATATLGDNVRVGRNTDIEGGVTLADDTRTGANVHLCDGSAPFSGRIDRGFVDAACP